MPMEKESPTTQNPSNMVPSHLDVVVNGWQVANESKEVAPKQKNFMELNKKSTLNGLHTAKEQNAFRKQNDIMVKTKKGEKAI